MKIVNHSYYKIPAIASELSIVQFQNFIKRISINLQRYKEIPVNIFKNVLFSSLFLYFYDKPMYPKSQSFIHFDACVVTNFVYST